MGSEFRVNGYQRNWQRDAHITTFSDGGFIVVYESYINNYDGGASATVVMSQRYDANGLRRGGETIIDGIDGTKADDPRVATLTNGGYVVTWAFDNYDDISTTREKVYVQAFNANGSARTSALRVDTIGQMNDALVPEVFGTANGGFKVVYGAYRNTGNADQIREVYSQQFNANGVKVGGNRLVNTNINEFDQFYVRSATLNSGASISVWNSESSFPTSAELDANEVRGTLTNAAGSVTRGDFRLTINYGSVAGGGGGYDVAALKNGGFVVSNVNYDFNLGRDTPDMSYYTMVRFYNSAGQMTFSPKIVFASDDLPDVTRVAQLTTGEIVVVWEQAPLPSQPNGGRDVYGRVLSSSGQVQSGVFKVSKDTLNYDIEGNPELQALAGGGFVVTYDSDSVDASGDGVAARIYGRGTAFNDRLSVDVTGHMNGLSGNDTLFGSGRGNMLKGGDGYDLIFGGAGNDTIIGGSYADGLNGGPGSDTLYGSLGNDALTGGAGADRFVFDTALSAARNVDKIKDFRHGVDELALDNAIFRALGAAGNLAAYKFKVIGNGANADANDRVIYDVRNDTLWYDTNGSGAGGRMAIAVFENNPVLSVGDFLVV